MNNPNMSKYGPCRNDKESPPKKIIDKLIILQLKYENHGKSITYLLTLIYSLQTKLDICLLTIY